MVLALYGKAFIDLRSQDKNWHKDAGKLLKNLLEEIKITNWLPTIKVNYIYIFMNFLIQKINLE